MSFAKRTLFSSGKGCRFPIGEGISAIIERKSSVRIDVSFDNLHAETDKDIAGMIGMVIDMPINKGILLFVISRQKKAFQNTRLPIYILEFAGSIIISF